MITTIYSFSGPDGSTPAFGLTPNGKLYSGVTINGGAHDKGVAFTTDGIAILQSHSFGLRSDGATPNGPLTADATGNLYGTCKFGGNVPHSKGTIYTITPSGIESLLHSFNGTDGEQPIGALALINNALWGVTKKGGTVGMGTIFKHDLVSGFATFHSFTGGPDGNSPRAGLTADALGNIYGTTFYGGHGVGSEGYGTLFKIDPAGNYSILYSFQPNNSDNPNFPTSEVTIGADGTIYGATEMDWKTGQSGAIWGWSTTAGFTPNLYNFCSQTNCTDGSVPAGAVTIQPDGSLIGCTTWGGDGGLNAAGTLYQLTPQAPPIDPLQQLFINGVLSSFPGPAPALINPSGAPLSNGSGGQLITFKNGGIHGLGGIGLWTP